MAQFVTLSDSLMLDAERTAEPFHRSVASQVELWAQLGRSVDLLLDRHEVSRLSQNKVAKPLSECLTPVGSPEGCERVFSYLQSQPYPHFEASPNCPGLMERIDEDGSRTTGHFVGREFVRADATSVQTAS